ncbi:MAG: preprotein translocase subunit SecG [Clostridia bacterium]|nr:preprotein translocase subunit SecG [Clostridia bacterium]
MTLVLSILVILCSLFMIVTVLLQSSNAKGLGAIAGEVTANMNKTKAAAVESKLELGTKISAAAFVVLSLILWIIG